MYAQLVNKRRDGLVTRRGEAKDPVGASEQSETGQNDDEVEEIKQVLTECKLWPVIEHAEAHAGQEIDKWESQGQAPAQLAEFQLVQIKCVMRGSEVFVTRSSNEACSTADCRSCCTCPVASTALMHHLRLVKHTSLCVVLKLSCAL